MKNVKNVHFLQIDHIVKKISKVEGVEILTSPEAYKKIPWTRKFFLEKPKEGYFIWVKKQVDFPLLTCFSLNTYKAQQNLENLLIIEKGLKIKSNVICNALKENLCASHKAKGKIVLKEGAKLQYFHSHWWGPKEIVESDYEFYLGKDSQLIYNYKNTHSSKNLFFRTFIEAEKNSDLNLNINLLGRNTKVKFEEVLKLKGANSRGVIRLRLVADKHSKIEGISKILALNKSTGHLDCQGLLIDKDSKISLIPNLVCENKKAQLTHEASIGKISEEELIYLRMRGLTEKQAIDLIVSGFLTEWT